MRHHAISLACLVLSSTCLAQTWIQVKSTSSPSARGLHGLAYNLLTGRTVLFGGFDGRSHLNDTWEYDGKAWTRKTPRTQPSPRSGVSMTCDVGMRRVLMFGGGRLNETWTWDGKDWTQLKPATSPPGRDQADAVYDSRRQRVVLFGGRVNSGFLNDTWEWDGTNWTSIQTSNAPSARESFAMAYDASRGRTVLFGGFGTGGVFFGDTWEYDGKDWTQRKPATSPPGRCCSSMAYDPVRRRVVLFGGHLNARNSTYHADTWEFDGRTWVQLKPATSPPARTHHDFMVYDTRRARMIIFGGWTGPSGTFGDTWEFINSQPLTGTPATISIASGGTHAFALDAGAANANRLYWIFGSVTGTSPGVTLASAAGSVNVPLNPDFWTDSTIGLANTPLLTKTRGALDGAGKGSASLNVPKITNQSAVGVKFYHAFLVYDANGNFYMASNPVELTLAK